ncbi:MAG: GNAT family N-acetyltransferase, partial [Alphaproteobacteria bacterium]|nr:GNAT family N-acetyltransferase [Alphaproteobacteria bacterium]
MWTVNADFGQTIFALVNFPQTASKRPGPKKALSDALGRLGSLEVRLARGKKEVRKAQRLRYEVFYQEGGAIPDARTAFTRRDADRFDKYCDHLIVIDHAAQTRRGRTRPKIVGAYRLMRDDMAAKAGGFYSEGEYDLAPLLARHAGKRALELGRSCVLAPYRSKRTIELLWRGLLAYVRAHDIDVMFGCASLHGANPLAHAQALSFLAHYAPAEDAWRVSARQELHTPMQM